MSKKSIFGNHSMMKQAFIFLAIFLPIFSAAQVDTTKNLQRVNAHGFEYKNWKADSSAMFPTDTFRLKQEWRGIAFKNAAPYFWNGEMWNPFGTVIDTTGAFITHLYRKTATDSVFYVKGGTHVFAFIDSSGVQATGVDTIYRKPGQDSIFFTINGGSERAIKDSTGGGGALSESDDNLTLVADVLGTNTVFQSLSDGATITFTTANGINGAVTLGGNRTLSIPSPQNGKTYTVKVTQDGTGGRTLSLPGGFDANLNLTAGATTTISGLYDGSTWVWMSNAGGAGSYLSTDAAGRLQLGGAELRDSTTLETDEKKFRFANATAFQLDLTNDSTDATGDIYYRGSDGYVKRLPIGANDEVLKSNGTTVEWGTGGGGDGTTVVLGSDVGSAASAGAQDITGLSWTATSGVLYEFEASIFYTSSDATIGASFGINGPASPTYVVFNVAIPQTNTATAQGNRPDWSVGGGSNATPSSIGIATVRGYFQTTSTGTVIMRFAPETATENGIVVKAGSRVKYWERN